MEVRPLEIVRVTLQMGPDDSAQVFLYPGDTHTRLQHLRRAGNQRQLLASKSRGANS